MARMQLIELEDQRWFPAPLRDALTDFLQYSQHIADMYQPMVPVIAKALERTHATRVIDLCSGGAGPWLKTVGHLEQGGRKIDVLLTDLYPNPRAFESAAALSNGRVRGHPLPVDATNVPAELTGFRTIFNGFHHFAPDMAKAILRDAVKARVGIGIFESTVRSVPGILSIVPAGIGILLLMPFIKPFRWSRLLWTYLIPAAPLVGLFDGVVSCLRTYSPEELRALVDELGDVGYDWEIGQVRGKLGPQRLTYLVGTPRRSLTAER